MRRNNMLSRIGSARRAKLAAYGAKDKDVEKAEKFQHGGRIKRAAGGRTEKQVDMDGDRPRARLDRSPRHYSLGGGPSNSGPTGTDPGTPGAPGIAHSGTPASVSVGAAVAQAQSEAQAAVNAEAQAQAEAAVAQANAMGLGYGAVGPEATTVPSDDPGTDISGGVVSGGQGYGGGEDGSDGEGGEGGEGGGDGGEGGGGEWRGGRTDRAPRHFALGGSHGAAGADGPNSGTPGAGVNSPSSIGAGSVADPGPGEDVAFGAAVDAAAIGGLGGFNAPATADPNSFGGDDPGSDGDPGGQGDPGGGGGGDGGDGGDGGGGDGGGEWRGGRTSRNRRR